MIERTRHLNNIRELISYNPIVAVLGARQVGKTTLARKIVADWEGESHFFDLESVNDVSRLDDPQFALSSLKGLIVLDEIHNRPELFPTLRVLADRPNLPAQFLILGSASPDLLQQGSETLAGRIAFHALPGFSLNEVQPSDFNKLWLRGGFPRAFTADSNKRSYRWRSDFVRTFLDRDLLQLGNSAPIRLLHRFWPVLAHYHGQILNNSELGRAFGISYRTVQKYLDLLEATFMTRHLKSWYANIGKRLVKSPKFYIRDSGLVHSLLRISNREELEVHPKVGASWEGFMLENLIQVLELEDEQCFFWATHHGAEIDLVLEEVDGLRGFEFKRTSAPRMTRSMHNALEDLKLKSIDVIHAGDDTYPLHEKVRAVSASQILKIY